MRAIVRSQLTIAAVCAAALMLCGGAYLRSNSARSLIVETSFDPRLLSSEIDGSLGVPIPTNIMVSQYLAFEQLFQYGLFIETLDTGTAQLLQTEAAYGPAPGKPGTFAFVYPPKINASKWRIQLRGPQIQQISLGDHDFILKSNVYVWSTPVFERMDADYHGLKPATPSVPVGTELFIPHGTTHYAAIATVAGRSKDHQFNDTNAGAGLELHYVTGVWDWLPASAITNYFWIPEK